MVNLTIINKENLYVPTFLSTSAWVIYDDKPSTFYQSLLNKYGIHILRSPICGGCLLEYCLYITTEPIYHHLIE